MPLSDAVLCHDLDRGLVGGEDLGALLEAVSGHAEDQQTGY